jgi:hypothetical protein
MGGLESMPQMWKKGAPAKTPVLQQEQINQAVQARIVQHHYVRAQVHTIQSNGASLLDETVNQLRKRLEFSSLDNYQLGQIYRRMTASLQAADLTINFRASSWFMQPNLYDSYTQMYERGVRNVGTDSKPDYQMRLSDPSGFNDPKTRVRADDGATFTYGMQVLPKVKAVPYNQQYDPASSKHQAIAKQFQYDGLRRVMMPGAMKQVNVSGDEVSGEMPLEEFAADNKHFNPKSRQVFAAVNYGRRPHGASTFYGNSYIVLQPKLMTNAIFFGCDTFNRQALVTAAHQISFNLLGGVYSKALPVLQADLIKACLGTGRLPDTEDGKLLLEAHLFQPLTFMGNIKAMYISRLDEGTKQQLGRESWTTIKANATKFLEKWVPGSPRKAFIDSDS